MNRPFHRVTILFLGFVGLTVLTHCVGTPPPAAPASEPEASDPLADRVGSGTARVTGTIRSADLDDSLPLGGVLMVLGDAVSHSNVDGTFVLLGVSAGRKTFFVDASQIQARDGHYGQFLGELDILEGQDRHLERPIYLPFIPLALEQTVTPDAATQVVTEEGIVLEIPAGSARMAGREYQGPIAVLSVAPELSPLPWPTRFDGRIGAALTVQPAGIEFPVPVPISFPAAGGGRRAGELMLLWALVGDGDVADNVAVGVHQVDQVVPLSGGLRSAGWHILTGMEFSLREPCLAGEPEEAMACLAAAAGLLDEVHHTATLQRPSAGTVLSRLVASLAANKSSAEQVQSIIDATEEHFLTARDALNAYQNVYDALHSPSTLHAVLDSVRSACAPVEGCRASSFDRRAIENELGGQLDLLTENVTAYSAWFDRLAASLRLLDPFYGPDRSQRGDDAEAFAAAANEFLSTYAAFEGADSPAATYDALVANLTRFGNSARALVDAVSAERGSGEGAESVLMRVCENLGATQYHPAADGIAPLHAYGGTDNDLDECLIVAMNSARGLTSVPMSEARLAATLHAPVVLPLTAGIASRAVPFDQPTSGLLTAEAPVHEWSLLPMERTGLHVRFVAEGDALAGYAIGNSSLQIARNGGFDVFNLPEAEDSALLVLGKDLQSGGQRSYRFSVEQYANRFDFGSPVAGTFDVETRAAAILFDAPLDQHVLIERNCCDTPGTLFTYNLLGPDGADVPRIDALVNDKGLGSELFALQGGGFHRVLITPFDGQFADYEFAVRSIPLSTPADYELGSAREAVFQVVGETVSFVFVAAGGTTLTVEGLTSTGPDPVRMSLIGPDGAVIAQSESLFLDASSFSQRSFGLPADGAYTISFRAPLNADPATGTITFRAAVEGP